MSSSTIVEGPSIYLGAVGSLKGIRLKKGHVRMLVHEARRIVDLVVDDEVEVLLGAMFRDVGVGEFLGCHLLTD